ncbi:MAG: ABC transporter transmembrane domain-containing protein, partial [Clostridia bacterium]|nr:ABC transporter transmembrane domain-containing protein [Clostridia bacterium]
MKEYIKIIKNWYFLSNPSKKHCFFSFSFVILQQIGVLIVPIFAAKATISLTSGLYNSGIIYLILAFAFLFLIRFFWHLNYMVFPKIIKKSYEYLNNKIVYKSIHANPKNYKNTSKEHILNTVHTDVLTLSKFGDKMAIAMARLVSLFITLTIIFIVNVWAGLIVIVADVLDYFIYGWLIKKRAVYEKKIREDQDFQYDKVSEMVDTRISINDLGVYKKVEKDYSHLLNKYNYDLKKKTFWDSMIDNGYLIFYSFLILCATIFLVVLTSAGTIQIETYFIIVAYVTTGINDTNNLYTLIPNLRLTKIATERVKNIIDFVENDKNEKGKTKLNDILGSIYFKHVFYKQDNEGNPELKNFDVFLKENRTHLILGKKNCGKRTVLNL